MNFITYYFDSPAQFFTELKDILDGGGFHDTPESRVSAFISMLVNYHHEFLDGSSQDLMCCCYRLLDSKVFQCNIETITRYIIERAIQSPEDNDMWITYHILLNVGKKFPKVRPWMLKSEFLAKLKYQILRGEGTKMQPLAVNMMYEICRVQQLEECDLKLVDEAFLDYLLDLVERTRKDEAEDLNYGTIKLLLVFNEQYMLSISNQSLHTQERPKAASNRNPLLTILANRPGLSCTFGENIIFILNRAVESALRVLILKLLYLIFTSSSLCEFFYTNDLYVLVDVVIRELWDLPEEEESLRHAYLRVMGPLLTNTQLKHTTYKRAEIVRVLRELGGGDLDSTLKRQLQEQLLKEQLLEQERTQHTRLTYKNRLNSTSTSSLARWASDRSGCSSPALAFEIEKKQLAGHSKLSNYVSSDSFKALQQNEKEEAGIHEGTPQVSQSPLQETTVFIRIEQPVPERKEPWPRAASPTTQRLVERVLREWLDNEMRDGANTTRAGLAVRGVTDAQPTET
ncbi:hypothetical protein BGZ65_003291 [Modicella reniformis]|uniref:SPIN90/Ldb17 leucine-rich domain-containing protein n=1 Tax=Modicella reniformis TaxID=1440133 RepID=A0A9P6MBC0_9FUNG|nr:hypothetical protein BGZ65_003291 [Modicella reniformis]